MALSIHGASSFASEIIRIDANRGLEGALNRLAQNTTIVLSPGSYVVDNPFIVSIAGISLIGESSDTVVLSPKNSGQPVFAVEANDFRLENVTIDGSIQGQDGRASSAIVFHAGAKGCLLRRDTFRGFQATAIVGYHVINCSISDNIVSHTAGDGIMLRGEGINVTGNIVHTIFDEPVDLAGRDISVRDNRIAFGRIGIALGSDGHSVVTGNLVVAQYEQGIAFAGSGFGEERISENIVGGAGIRPYEIGGPADGSSMFVENNVACKAPTGFPQDIHDDAQDGLAGASLSDCEDATWSGLFGFDIDTAATLPWTTMFVDSYASLREDFPAVSDSTEQRSGYRMAAQLRHLNPGILSIDASGQTVTSEITRSLADTLTNWPDVAVNPVRSPFLRAAGARRWILRNGGKDILIVTRRPDGPRLRITVLDDEEVGIVDEAVLLWDTLHGRLRHWKQRLENLL